MPPSSTDTASRKPLGSNKAHLQEYCFAGVEGYGQVLQVWRISEIPGGSEGLDQLVGDGKTLRGSAEEVEAGSHKFVAQVTIYARALGGALARTTKNSGESSKDSPQRAADTLAVGPRRPAR